MTTTLARDLRSVLIVTVFMIAVCGLLYPLAMTGIAETIFPHEANGSLIEQDGAVVGSELIGQQFNQPQYFHSRPSAAGGGYDAGVSSGSNLGPTSAGLVERVKTDLELANLAIQPPAFVCDLVPFRFGKSGDLFLRHRLPAAERYQL